MSVTVAINRAVVPPLRDSVSVFSLIAKAGIGVTDMFVAAVLVSHVAVIADVRMAPPRYAFVDTRPEADTSRTVVSEADQAIVRPVSVFPSASLRVTVSWSVAPIPIVPVAGVRETVATGEGATATVTVLVIPSAAAVMVTDSFVPPRTYPAVTRPVAETVAVFVLDDDHVTTRLVSAFPSLPRVAAVS